MANVKDVANQRFGRLIAMRCIGSNNYKQRIWECICDCGKLTNVATTNLLSGNTRSCGCLHDEMASERFGKHHGTGTKLYRTWKNMKQRCYKATNKKYHNYGGKGVRICDEWLSDFGEFQKWSFQNGYKEGLTIERKDPNGNYEPENCEWIPFGEQQKNRSNAIKIIFNGEERYLKDVARECGLPYGALRRRYLDGWDPDVLFKKPTFGFKRKYHA